MSKSLQFRLAIALLSVATLAAVAMAAQAPSTVDDVQKYSWGPNFGWIDWRGDGTSSGAHFDNRHFASGYIYSANVGWIFLGSGTPAVGSAYSNADGADSGINIDDAADPYFFLLSGLAWSANCGWISFNVTDPATRPRIEKATGALRGYAYAANLGWLALEQPDHLVITGLRDKNAARPDWALYR